MFKFIVKIVFFVTLGAVATEAKELDLKPGMWQWTTTMQMQEMGFSMPPITYSYCISEKDLIPTQSSQESKDCKLTQNKTVGNTVMWTVECTTEGEKSVSTGKMTYKKTTAEGKIEMTSQGMKMISTISGKRTGNCK